MRMRGTLSWVISLPPLVKTFTSSRLFQAGVLFRPSELRLDHAFGQFAGESVLLARVVAPQHRHPSDGRLRGMPEPGSRPRHGHAVAVERREGGVPCVRAEG